MRNAGAFSLVAIMLPMMTALAASPQVTIWDVMSRGVYRNSYKRLFLKESAVPQWIASTDAVNKASVDAGKTAFVGNSEIEIFTFCKAHDCSDNTMIVGFRGMGESATALLATPTQFRFFGNPNASEMKALAQHLPAPLD